MGKSALGLKCSLRDEGCTGALLGLSSDIGTVGDEGGNRAGLSWLPMPACLTLGCYHLLQVAEEWAQGTFKLNPNDEDIHTANERRLKV